MPDDARARGIAALDAAYSCAPIDDPNAVQVGGGHVVVTYEQAVDALLAAGWAPPPATSSAAPEGAALPGTEEPVAAQDSNTRTRSLPPFHKVAGTCPACSGSTLMLGAGDRVTCSLIGCPDPMAASRRLVPLDDAAIERAARAMRAWDSDLGAGPWETLPGGMRKAWCDLARVALAAAEETPHA